MAPTPPQTRLTGEPARVTTIEGKLRWPFEAVPASNGTLMLTHRVAQGCYFRLIKPNGSLAGWFGPRGLACPRVMPLASGFLGFQDEGEGAPEGAAVDLSQPPRQIPTHRVDTVRKPRAGDTYLRNYCAFRACTYSPSTHTIYNVDRYGYVIDSAGRLWAEGPRSLPHVVTVSVGNSRWQSPPFPAYPNELVASVNGSAATYLKKHWHRIYVTSDYGRTWEGIHLPRAVQVGGLAMTNDGRVVLTPVFIGRRVYFWRGTDPRNTTFERLDAGPITSILTAGNRLYGMATRDWIGSRRGVVWMSTDAGDTWRQVLSTTGSTPHTSAVPAPQLPDPIIPPKS